MPHDDSQLVIFTLVSNAGTSEYGVPIFQVKEIIRLSEITKLPQAPAFVEGIINLRGRIIPIIDLKKRFGMSGGEYGDSARIIVFSMDGKDTGVIVNDVSEVIRLPEQNISSLDGLATSGISSKYIKAVGKLDKRLIIIIDLNSVFSDSEQNALCDLTNQLH